MVEGRSGVVGAKGAGERGHEAAVRQCDGRVPDRAAEGQSKPSPATTASSACQHRGSPSRFANKPVHARSKSAVPHRGSLVADAANRRASHVRNKQPAQSQLLVDVAPDSSSPRQSSIQLPKTTMSFLQAGDSFTFYPPKKGCTSLKPAHRRALQSQLWRSSCVGDFGELQMRQERGRRRRTTRTSEGREDTSAVLLSCTVRAGVPGQAGHGAGLLPPTHTDSCAGPKAPRCLSLLDQDDHECGR